MTTASTPLGIAGFLAPALLWSAHFLIVYVFVSLACLWGWGDAGLLGIGLIKALVALFTLGVVSAILVIGAAALRVRDAPGPTDDAPQFVRRRFTAWTVAAQSGLFAVATVLVGLPTLLRPACY